MEGEEAVYQEQNGSCSCRTACLSLRCAVLQDQWNLYGHQTLYMNVEDTQHANGVYLHNTNAMGGVTISLLPSLPLRNCLCLCPSQKIQH